jgi:hypothetical protein
MAKHGLRLVLSAMLLALSVPAAAQPPQTIPRIGFLAVTSLAAIAARVEAFRQGLRELGYVEGKNLVIEYRSAGAMWSEPPRSPPSSCVSRSMSSSRLVRWTRVMPSTPRRRFPLS